MKPERPFRAFKLLIITILMLGLVACGLQIQKKDQGQAIRIPEIPNKIEPVQQVEVKFTVLIPETDLENVELALDILDDLSAYQDNIKRYPMKSIGENRYEVNVLLDEGFDIRYRYTMIAPEEMTETTVYGQPVDMRMVIIEKDLSLSDTVYNWTPSPNYLVGGTLNGYLKDYQTQEPIPDIIVSVAGMLSITDMTGYFGFENIPEGEHNLVAYALDGSFSTLQQKALVASQQITRVNASLYPLEKVKLQFQITPSTETVGVPIRLAGNFVGTGAYYAENFTSGGSIASLMPLLSQMEADLYTIELELYAGSAFRYRYSLGNGYTNAERTEDGLLLTRQFIVPKTATTVKDEIFAWRADDSQPVTINVDAPIDMPPNELVSVQLFRKNWNQPIPMWHIGNNKWMFLLYGNGVDDSVQIRFCRNDNCEIAWDETSYEQPIKINFAETNQIDYQISEWHNWNSEGVLPGKREESLIQSYLTGVELIQDYRPANLVYLEENLAELRSTGVNWIILRPSWDVLIMNGLPRLQGSGKQFMLYRELGEITRLAQTAGFRVSLYPNLNFPMIVEDWWNTATRDEQWWQTWYQQYAHFVSNYTLFAEKYKLDQLIIGGDDIDYSLPNGIAKDEDKLGTPDHALDTWISILDQAQKAYSGAILWASALDALPNENFTTHVDGYYVLLIYTEETKNAETLSQVIESQLLPFYENYQKPIFIGLNLPALSLVAMEYTDHLKPILSTVSNGENDFVDLNQQSILYRDFACTLRTHDWINGISSRGFNLVLHLSDFSSSIYGKPAMNEFLNCMNNTH